MTWRTVKLGDVCDFQGGSQPPKKEFIFAEQEGYIRFLQIRDFKSDKNLTYIPNSTKNRLCTANDILIGRYGASVGQILRGLGGAYNVALMKTIPNEELISKEWLYAYLNSQLFQKPLSEVSSRSAQNGFSKDDISTFAVPLPPLAEQQRIVAKLDDVFAEIDEAINKAEAKETEVQKLKTSLLSSYLNGDDLMWKKVKISDVCQIQPRKAQVKSKLKDSDEVSFMPMKDLGIQNIYPKSNQIKKLEKVYNSYTYFEDNDILLAKITPCFENGKLGIASNLVNGVGFGSSEYIVLRCSEEVIPQYIYFCLNQPSFRIIGENQMSGAVGHKRVPIEYVENTKIYLPPIADQKRIVAKLDAANTEFRNANESIAKSKANLLALKSAILHQELQSSEAA